MRGCPDTDAAVAIGAALGWDVANGLHHLQTCTVCRARMDLLQRTRSALAETAAVDAATLARISAALHAEADRERARQQAGALWVSTLEAVLAGVAAPVVLITSGMPIPGAAALLLTSGLGAALLLAGRRLRLHAA